MCTDIFRYIFSKCCDHFTNIQFLDLDSFKVSMAALDKYPQKIISENMNIIDDTTKIEAGEAVRSIYTSGLFQNDLASSIRVCTN